MAAISITCPTTGKHVSTGIAMEQTSFYRSVLTGNSVRCPHCRATHYWSKSDAIFDEVPSAELTTDPVAPVGTRARRQPAS